MELGSNIFLEQMSAYMQRVDEQGILSKFLSCFGYDWESFIKPLIEDQTSIHNPEESVDLLGQIMNLPEEELRISNTKFLRLIGKDLGSPIDVMSMPEEDQTMYQPGDNENYPDLYRKILTLIVALYKWRGTALAIKYWGYLLDLDLEVVTLDYSKVKYDSGFNYDQSINTSEITSESIKFDMGTCDQCTKFYIKVNNAIYTGKKYV
jgi:hypothetical protein